MTRRRSAIAATALLTVGACTSQEAVSSVSNAPTSPPVTEPATTIPDVSTTVAEAPVATTTMPPETTVPETTTTVAPTTTIAPPSGDPTSASTEFFGGGDADGWLYLGRWTGDGWEASTSETTPEPDPDADAEDADSPVEAVVTVVDPTIDVDADVSVHELDVEVIDGRVTGSDDACSTGRPGPVISPNARAPEEPGFGYRSIAFQADWPTRPRRVEVVDADVPAYVDAGIAAFGETDTDASGGSISQITLADLDGDGDTESVVVFEGEGFSALLLIDAQTGDSITMARSIQTSTLAPAGGGEGGSPAPIITPNEQHRVLDLVDVNGDGLMEVVAHTYVDDDDAGVSIFTYDGEGVDDVLTAGC